MTTLVETCWGPRQIDDKPYWHFVSPSSFFYNNVRFGKGALLSVSTGIQAEPGIEKAQTLYSLSRTHDEKEKVFEEIRQTGFPACPPRLETLYVLDEYRFVERAQKKWFLNDPKEVHEYRILIGSITHRADTVWLNSLPEQWRDYAQKCWNGEMSQNPFPEVLVHGALYFLDWETFPSA
ncbi:MAG: hypothetical protein H8D67_30485 [Deltaproteobacteria bacterium]|nr:hypothetical protein [Deltaproteobacteria bacterium]